MKRESKIKTEICDLRSNLYLLLNDDDKLDRTTILKASAELDKAILKYIKNVKH